MAHEIMFDPADPLLARVRAIAMALPAAREEVSHGRPALFTTKVFAYDAGTPKEEHVTGVHPQRLTVLLDPDERLAMLEEGAIAPAYLAPYGWIAVELEDADRISARRPRRSPRCRPSPPPWSPHPAAARS